MPQQDLIKQLRDKYPKLFENYSDEELGSIISSYTSVEEEPSKLVTKESLGAPKLKELALSVKTPSLGLERIGQSIRSGVGKAWEAINTPLWPEFGPELGFIEPGGKRGSIGEVVTSPIAIAGELAGGIGALRMFSRARKMSQLGKLGSEASDVAEVMKIGPKGEVVSIGGKGDDALAKLNKALEEMVPLRKEQEAIYTAERAEKVFKARDITTPGEKGARERLSALGGEHTKLKGTELRTKLEQPDVNELFDRITAAPITDEFVKMHARTGLIKLLDGNVPQMSELKVLGRVFGDEFLKKTIRGLTLADRKQTLISEAVNLPRSVMASWDFSAPLRQGLPLITRKEFWTSLDDMFKSWGSEKSFRGIIESIENHPRYGLALESKLNMTDLGPLRGREEAFMSTWAEKIPLVRRSNRAYVGFLDKLRFDTFNSLVDDAVRMGLKPEQDLRLSRNLAGFINNATGRGSLGALERHAILLNSTLFAPRLIASRLQMLNPYYYYKLDPFTRKQALKALFSVAGAGATVTGLGVAAGGEVDLDSRSSDFGKLKIGNVRVDPYAGFQQYIVAASKLLSGEQKSSVTGRVQDLTEKTPYSQSRLDVLSRFGEQKLHPVVTFGIDMLRGTSAMGQPVELPDAIVNRVLPILVQDIIELAQEEPKLLPYLIPPAAFGMSVTSYGPQTKLEPYSPTMDLIRKQF